MDFIINNKIKRIDKLGYNKKWCLLSKNMFLKAHEIKDFMISFKKKEIVNFLEINNLVFSNYLTKFFYKGWGQNYLDTSNFEKFRLSLLQTQLQSYINSNPIKFTDLDDIFNTLQLIIQIHEQILLINEGFKLI
tara:strand:- start:158 stop:559 length:402 start_codon:yes stop_codon:yes gene_type:complete